MPSTHQTGAASSDDWKGVVDDPDSDFAEAAKMLGTKNDATIRALVREIRRKERARTYIQAEVDLAEHADRDPRKKLIGMLNAKVSELTKSEDNGGD
jgi:hypothetical protein